MFSAKQNSKDLTLGTLSELTRFQAFECQFPHLKRLRNGKVEVHEQPKQQSNLLSLQYIPDRHTLGSWRDEMRRVKNSNPISYLI